MDRRRVRSRRSTVRRSKTASTHSPQGWSTLGDIGYLDADGYLFLTLHPNEEMGEEVKAVVEPAAGVAPGPELEAELIAYCREHLAGYKCPRSVDFDPQATTPGSCRAPRLHAPGTRCLLLHPGKPREDLRTDLQSFLG